MELKEWMNKGGHYDVEMKGWMENVALRCANEQGGWKRDCIINLRKDEWKREGIMISK